MRTFEAHRRCARRTGDVVRIARTLAGGHAPEPRELAHAICDDMIGACAVAAHAQPADHLAARIKRDAAAERDDAPERAPDAASLFEKARIEWIRVVQATQRSARLRGCIEIGGR